MIVQELKKAFNDKFTSENYIVVKSPGRVNLIGEHTDYNDGFVLPASIDKAIYFVIASNEDKLFRFYSYDLEDYYETPIDKIEICDKHWANYLLGVIAQYVNDGNEVQGFNCVFGGDIPLGAGMSSSAAIECGLAFAINDIQDLGYSTLEMVKFSQKAEHEYAGVMCGIMDQFAVMHGEKNKVIKLDCRSLEYKLFPLDMSEYKLILVNTGVKHSLASSEYNKRRIECEKGVKLLQKYDLKITSLRDVSLELLQKYKTEFDKIVYNRCTYVIEENIRLEKACNALNKSDFIEFGKQMYGSHTGLKEKYEVSCDELDQLVDISKNTEGVIGARMMGGGFGGCTINLVNKNSVSNFKNTILAHYKTPKGGELEIIEVVIEGGTSVVERLVGD